MSTQILKNEKACYIFDIKLKDNLVTYHKVKERFGQKIQDRDGFIKNISQTVKKYLIDNSYDFIIYPESSSDFIEKIVTYTDIKSIKVYKTDIKDIERYTQSLNLQKMERKSHLERIENMGNTFKINALKASQRDKYESILFKKVIIPPGKGLIIDDSLFSGTTFRALENITGIKDWFAIFSK